MDVKTCKQCGELKPISQFRRYYGNRRGTYTMCKSCERINSREKYLSAKGDERSVDENAELDKIHQLYDYQRSLGLNPPGKQSRRPALSDELDDMLDKYRGMAEKVVEATGAIHDIIAEVPAALNRWLVEELTDEPDYYLDDVYETLRETYRPCVGIDKDTMMPVYDEKYKAILDRILERFSDYEDSYYGG